MNEGANVRSSNFLDVDLSYLTQRIAHREWRRDGASLYE
jgi:hypothetical protein